LHNLPKAADDHEWLSRSQPGQRIVGSLALRLGHVAEYLSG